MEKVNEQHQPRAVAKKIGSKVASQVEVAKKYYSLISTVYNRPLTEMEIALLVFTALWGTISTPPARADFLEYWGKVTKKKASRASLNNVISQLQQKGFLKKDEQHKIRLHPQLLLDMEAGQYKFTVNLEVEDGH